MKAHLLPILSGGMIAANLAGATVPWAVALAPLAVMLAVILLNLAQLFIGPVLIERAIVRGTMTATKKAAPKPEEDNRPLPGFYL